MKLLGEYDILVEGFRPGVMANLGLDYESVSAAHPRVIYVSISGYGQTGPYYLRGGHDINYVSLAGCFDKGGGSDGEPAVPTIPVADLAGGSLFSLAGLLAAVIHRERTGSGQFVDVAMYDGAFAMGVFAFCHMLGGSRDQHILSGCHPFYNVYKTKDGRHFSLGAIEIKFWRNFCEAVGREDLISQQFGGKPVVDEVAEIFRSRTRAEWVDFLKDVDACCEPILTVEELLDSPLCRSRGLVGADPGGRPCLANPIKLSALPPDREFRPAPGLGQHNREVLTALGLTEEEIAGLSERGTI
jgi:crotonobetainyl-CoA:carnitine CoA-transferase CaiB-like acyl-CoA transferase